MSRDVEFATGRPVGSRSRDARKIIGIQACGPYVLRIVVGGKELSSGEFFSWQAACKFARNELAFDPRCEVVLGLKGGRELKAMLDVACGPVRLDLDLSEPAS